MYVLTGTGCSQATQGRGAGGEYPFIRPNGGRTVGWDNFKNQAWVKNRNSKTYYEKLIYLPSSEKLYHF